MFRTFGHVPTCYSPVCHSCIATGVRLACIRPAASVRSEPGSNSQVELRTCSRPITTLTCLLTSSQAFPRAAPREKHSERFGLKKRRYRRSLVSALPVPEGPAKARKDSAAYVSLSSYSLVKEHDGKPHRPNARLPPSVHADETFAKANSVTTCSREPRVNLRAACGGAALVVGAI